MPNATSRFSLNQYNESERWMEDGATAGSATPDGHNDAVRHADTHTLLVVEKTADYTASNYDMVLADASGGVVNVTLPTASTDVQVDVKKIDATANNVTLSPPGSATIDGLADMNISTQYASRTAVANSTDYFIR